MLNSICTKGVKLMNYNHPKHPNQSNNIKHVFSCGNLKAKEQLPKENGLA